MQPDVKAALDLPQQHLIVLNFQIRVVAALDENAAGASADGILDLGNRLLPLEVTSGLAVSADFVVTLTWWTGLPVLTWFLA